MGSTKSTDFPVVASIQGALGGIQDAFITKVSAAPVPVVAISLSRPGAKFFARGSTLGYDVTATNTTAVRQCFDYWETVTLPGGIVYPPVGALFGPINLCLNAGQQECAPDPRHTHVSARRWLRHQHHHRHKPHASYVTSESHFNFEVTAFNPVTKNPQTSWRLIENGFRK